MVHLEDIKKEAKQLLENGKVKYVAGYKRSTNGLMAAPVFVYEPGEVEQLIWEATCVHNLTRFLVDDKKKQAREKEPDKRPVAIIAKGCDSRAVNVLLQENYINREDVYIIGVSCEQAGMVDAHKVDKKFKAKKPEAVRFERNGKFQVVTRFGNIKVPVEEIMADRCLECKANYPVIADVLLGDKVKRKAGGGYRSLDSIEKLSPQDRWAFWQQQMDKCIRCYACRSVCPMCYCDECVVDSTSFAVKPDTGADEKAQKIKWVDKSPLLSETTFYHMIRALHLAGRCIDCGECQRVCPVDIPLRHLNKKLEKEAQELFDYESGFQSDQPSLVSSFRDTDPEKFIL